MSLPENIRSALSRTASTIGTPCFAYVLDGIKAQFDSIEQAFGDRFEISFAVKSNPNLGLLKAISPWVSTLDISSIGELERSLAIGFDARKLTFSGPAKRPFELERAVEAGCGELVCESENELEALDRLADKAGRKLPVFIRINPDSLPKHFGMNMAGRPSQFGIDEQDLDGVLTRLPQWKNLGFAGFHCYSGTNCLNEEAIAENFDIFISLFRRFSEAHELRPVKLIFGSGFGIPYHDGDTPLDLDRLAGLINPKIDSIREHPLIGNARYVLEMGRFLVGESGYFLTSVVAEKFSRGTEIRLCDGGMNNHLGACGLLGMVIRRPYPMWKVSEPADATEHSYMLVGPLCTTIDTLADRIALPRLSVGDVIAVGSSGAYGFSSSPTRFISHPEPREALVRLGSNGPEITDVSE